MKYILLIGASHAGKSTTVDAVCKKLKPSSIRKLTGERTLEVKSLNEELLTGTYVIEVKGKFILVTAGAPTEQGIRITVLVQIIIDLKITIDFALVVMRSYERSEGFNTQEELKQMGECLLEETIYKIPGDDYKQSAEWNNRINRIVNCIQTNL